MEILTRSSSVRDRLKPWREGGKKIALVPTAGTLHKGHMSLVAQAQEKADRVVVSIVSGAIETQSSLHEADRDLLEKIDADVVFVPPVQEIYPFGLESATVMELTQFAAELEGAGRPARFARATTVLVKLFNIVRPDFAYFGERDYQQLLLVRQMVQDLFFDVEIVSSPTLRESSGLALASANRQLSVVERATAARLCATLRALAKRIDGGERAYEALEKQGFEALAGAGFRPEYVAIRQAADLAPVKAGCRDMVILAAASLGGVRLIDNVRVRLIERR